MNGQAESSIDSIDREPELEPAEEVTENGPTGGCARTEDANLSQKLFSLLNALTFYTHLKPSVL